MAMTKCKECGKDISTKADACPNCGAKQVRTSGCAKVVLVLLGLVLFGSLLNQCGQDSSSSSSASTSTPRPSVSPSANPEPVVQPPLQPGSQWMYQQDVDQMAKGTTHFAAVQSTNTVDFDWPYSGSQHATLTLRTHPRYGKDVILAIQKGQILCRSYEDCTILVRFDDKDAQRYSAVGAADNSTESIFIRNYSRFVGAMLKAKKVRIAIPVYQEGEPSFEFDVSGFDTAKYIPKK